MKLTIVPVTPFQQNCSIVWCSVSNRAAIVDPGGDAENIKQVVAEQGVTVDKVLLTHGHLDHAGAAASIAEHYQVPVVGPHRDDDFWLSQLPQQAQRFQFAAQVEPLVPDQWLNDGEQVTVGERQLQVLHCPGHTPGHVVFVDVEARVAWVGDVLFHGSIGRSDFPRGDHQQLVRSIREQLWPLGDDITFIPGHGPTSTFAEERANNPFVADSRFG
ncbi:MBL fold metallo-hydrolase [Idiomarina xiamenensis]|uniref:Beta-lactamase-like protein n=1 Tax=Idiomarina xiamenensis 10-D-4 TaxID=740709 RepID=K2L322_9GAMM|nr:MBL fold metallo-hydrolase [Idiomarina xiamenensis]EKE84300.1 beta-lactamase-like protein [Idiomarina xiamenensis 10-D-4]